MRRYLSRVSALAAVALVTGMISPLTAGAQPASTTYDIEVGQDFFEQGVPGFSARYYPGSIKVHQGDTIRFSFAPGALEPVGTYPQESMGDFMSRLGQPGTFLLFDPDDGQRALKFDLEMFFDEGHDCGTQDNPCRWGTNTEHVFPAFREEPPFDTYVTIDAPAGTTLWSSSINSPDANVNFKVQVVGRDEDASTQAELDARGQRLKAKDYEDALALHNKMQAKQTWHLNAAGKKVYDVFVGAAGGPIEMFASYPRKIAVPKGARVQFHFMSQLEPHTATFGGAKAREVLQNFIMPGCDPDGDDGAGPDVEPTGFDETSGLPICPEGTTLEADVHDLLPWAVGDGKISGRRDYENSGVILPHFPDGSIFDANRSPWTEKFTKVTNRKGFKYICLIHGGFMGGRVRVKG